MRLSVLSVQLTFLVLVFFRSALVSAVTIIPEEESIYNKLINSLGMQNPGNDYPQKWVEFTDKFTSLMKSKWPEGKNMIYRSPHELAKYGNSKKICTVSKDTLAGLKGVKAKAPLEAESSSSAGPRGKKGKFTPYFPSSPPRNAPDGYATLATLLEDRNKDYNEKYRYVPK